jgi:hypothetical protein
MVSAMFVRERSGHDIFIFFNCQRHVLDLSYVWHNQHNALVRLTKHTFLGTRACVLVVYRRDRSLVTSVMSLMQFVVGAIVARWFWITPTESTLATTKQRIKQLRQFDSTTPDMIHTSSKASEVEKVLCGFAHIHRVRAFLALVHWWQVVRELEPRPQRVWLIVCSFLDAEYETRW